MSASCLASPAATGCTTFANLGASTDIAVSPDGRNVYALTSVALLTFSRDAATGALTPQDCIRAATATGCRTLPLAANLSSPTALAITPDGANLYVANSGTSSITEFTRAADGTLTVRPDTPCISNAGAPPPAPCNDARALALPQDLAVAGNHLYVASSNAVTVLNIGSGGSLTQAPDAGQLAGCVTQSVTTDGCADGRGLSSPQALAVTANRVYAATTGRSIAVITRDATTGLLSMPASTTACLSPTAGECTAAPDLNGAAAITDIAAGAGGQLYASLTANANAARVVTYDPSGDGLVRRAGVAGCVVNGSATSDCSAGRGLATPTQLVPSVDGADVYVTGDASGAVVELDRAANGALAMRNDVRGCLAPAAIANCTTLASLSTPTGLAISPDGHFVYASSGATGRLSALKRDSSGPVCAAASVTVQAGSVSTLTFPCSDPDGDKLTFETVNPPTLGNLGLLDTAAGTIVYAAPQGQNGSTTYTYRTSYAVGTFGAFPTDGTITINVTGAPASVFQGIDNDHDGFFAGQDCNDNNPNIRPGAVEIKGNNIDENCDGLAEPFPTMSSGVLHNWDWTKHGTTFTLKLLKITQSFPKGWSATIKCSGKGCPFKSKKLKGTKVKKNASSVLASLSSKQRGSGPVTRSTSGSARRTSTRRSRGSCSRRARPRRSRRCARWRAPARSRSPAPEVVYEALPR